MLKAVIFDMDGVLIDSEPFHLVVNEKIFANLGINLSEEEYHSFIGTTHKDMWSTIKKRYNLPQSVPELVNMQVSGNIDYIKNEEIEPIKIKGVSRLLSKMAHENIKIGIASSSPTEVIELVINKLGISGYFSAITGGEEIEKGKPAPDIFLRAAKRLNVKPPDCLVVEDSKNGVLAAKAAGMKCIGFQNPNSGNQNLEKADLIIDRYDFVKISTLKNLFKNEKQTNKSE
jgi:beta-phosphoglucomutase-like phosphatase (HAD superfamily)